MKFLPTILLFTTIILQTNARPILEIDARIGDSLTLDKYIISQNIKAERTPEGVFFTAHTEGVGKEPQQGDFVKIRYVGKLLSGKVFDDNFVVSPLGIHARIAAHRPDDGLRHDEQWRYFHPGEVG